MNEMNEMNEMSVFIVTYRVEPESNNDNGMASVLGCYKTKAKALEFVNMYMVRELHENDDFEILKSDVHFMNYALEVLHNYEFTEFKTKEEMKAAILTTENTPPLIQLKFNNLLKKTIDNLKKSYSYIDDYIKELSEHNYVFQDEVYWKIHEVTPDEDVKMITSYFDNEDLWINKYIK
jgi:hypothetical protein